MDHDDVQHTGSGAHSGIRTSEEGAGTLVVLWGEVDASLRDEASMSMVDVVRRGGPVVIDVSGVTFIDSSGLAFILQLHRLGEESGLPVALRDPSPLVVDLLEMIGMTHRIPVVHALPDTPGDPVAQPA